MGLEKGRKREEREERTRSPHENYESLSDFGSSFASEESEGWEALLFSALFEDDRASMIDISRALWIASSSSSSTKSYHNQTIKSNSFPFDTNRPSTNIRQFVFETVKIPTNEKKICETNQIHPNRACNKWLILIFYFLLGLRR